MNTTLLVLNYCTTLWNNFFSKSWITKSRETLKSSSSTTYSRCYDYIFVTLRWTKRRRLSLIERLSSSRLLAPLLRLQPLPIFNLAEETVDPSTRRPIPVNARLSFLRSHHGRKGTAEQKLDVWILLFCSERSVNTNGCVPSRIASFRVDFAATGREIASRDPPHRSFV